MGCYGFIVTEIVLCAQTLTHQTHTHKGGGLIRERWESRRKHAIIYPHPHPAPPRSLFLLFFFSPEFLCSLAGIVLTCESQVGLEPPEIFLSQPCHHWDCRCEPPHSGFDHLLLFLLLLLFLFPCFYFPTAGITTSMPWHTQNNPCFYIISSRVLSNAF